MYSKRYDTQRALALGSRVAEMRKQMMQLSPKAIRFIIKAVEHYQTYHEEQLRDEHLTEEDAADLTNDHQYLEVLQTALHQYHGELMCQCSPPTNVG
jgi:histidinol dehydrogenase